MFKKTILASSIMLITTAASASGGYIGASAGLTDYDVRSLDDGSSIELTGGYKFGNYFAIEASYIDLGDADIDFGEMDDVASGSVNIDGLNVSAVGLIPLGDTVTLYGKAGFFQWDSEGHARADLGEFGIQEQSFSDSGTDLSYGLGVSVNLSEKFSLGLEYQSFSIEEEDPTNISLGAQFNF